VRFASSHIGTQAAERISDGDVVLTYGRSHSVEEALKAAHKKGTQFRVIIVDSRPLCEGKRLAATLSATGIHVTYMLLNAISYSLRSVSKVLIGAAALLSNGAVISRAGTAMGTSIINT
jgi:translation initiation factor eIF-2B subunit delta